MREEPAPTLPEREGWVNREKLYDFSGRSRKPQMALAKEFGFEDYAQPAGGCCFLTDEQYSVKLQDLWKSRGSKQYEMDDIMLLKVGRHIRPEPGYKLIISREEGEGKFLQGYRNQYPSLKTTSHPGPCASSTGILPTSRSKKPRVSWPVTARARMIRKSNWNTATRKATPAR